MVSVSTAAAPPLSAPGEWCRMSVPGEKPGFQGRFQFLHGVVVRPDVDAPVQ
jgi:hypothetical protein